MHTLEALIDRHGITVDEHLDRQASIPIVHPAEVAAHLRAELGLAADAPVDVDGYALTRQGDVIVIINSAARASTAVAAEGVPVVRGEAGGNTHAILADSGPVFCDPRQATVRDLTLATLTVPEGSVAYLAHPEHGYTGIGPGTYTLRRQREQADELRIVAD